MPAKKRLSATLELVVEAPTKNADTIAFEATDANIAPVIVMLSACPKYCIVDSVPDATPSLDRGTEPITALMFGAEKSPNPNPITNRFRTPLRSR